MEKDNYTRYLVKGSRIVSIIFHPAFLPAYGLLIIFMSPTMMMYLPYQMKRIIFLLASVNMIIIPLAVLPLLRFRNMISSYSVESRKERALPLGIGSLMYIITTFVLYSYQIPIIIKSFVLAASITLFTLLLITFRWKISLHSAGMGGLLATVIILSIRMNAGLMVIWLPGIFISSLVMSSRLYMNSHNPSQVYSGFAVGFITFFLVMMLF